jgi:1-aminocyclopropane-1-carboxylate deaminase/D-cysteine desulfhydrase-like pyridoxal-dependent ACC family enzyme
VAADARARGADTLVTCGGIQSNHARATAAVAAKLGMACVLVANGAPQAVPTANALLNNLLGASMRYVPSRDARAPAMQAAAEELRASGRTPFVIPLGASTGLGAAAYAQAVGETIAQIGEPDAIVHASSSGGTQAGLVAGCIVHRLSTRVIGVSADDPSRVIRAEVRRVGIELEDLLGAERGVLSGAEADVDDRFVGEGYGIPTALSDDATRLCARTEALFVDPTYTAKAMAALIARAGAGEFSGKTVLFWHTGGQVALFA